MCADLKGEAHQKFKRNENLEIIVKGTYEKATYQKGKLTVVTSAKRAIIKSP